STTTSGPKRRNSPAWSASRRRSPSRERALGGRAAVVWPRWKTATSCPAAARRRTRRGPMNRVPPMTRTRIPFLLRRLQPHFRVRQPANTPLSGGVLPFKDTDFLDSKFARISACGEVRGVVAGPLMPIVGYGCDGLPSAGFTVASVLLAGLLRPAEG